MQRLPNLGALRVFEAAARHESFSRAADELFVTHGAVSHQIRGLERALGVTLFRRIGKRVALTDAGERYSLRIRDALRSIADATASVRSQGRDQRLVVSVLPSFASRWLMPRIGRFIERHPKIDIEVRASSELASFDHDGVDVGLRHGRGPYPGLHAETLFQDTYFPACSPSLRDGVLPASPEDLLSYPLLQSSGDEPWRLWFDAAGLQDAPEPLHGPRYLDSSHLLDAAIRGQGIALVRSSIAMDDLRDGRLVRLFRIDASDGGVTQAVCPIALRHAPRVEAFFAWLREEASTSHGEQRAAAPLHRD